MPQRIGFVGLGNLGKHLAASTLRAGYDLTVNDADADRAGDLLAAGALWAASPRGLALQVDTVVTCLPSSAAVNDVMTGPGGILNHLAPGCTWVDMSTNDRDELRRLADLAASKQVHCLEAPVTGGVHRAATGEMTVLVGGDEDVYHSHEEILRAVGNEVIYMGPLGSASIIKVITNMLAFIHLVAAGEALMLAKCGGIDLGTAFAAIRASSGNSFVHETESQVVLNGSYNIGFTLDLACKDLGFASQMGRELAVPLALQEVVEAAFHRARVQYGGSAWSPMVVKLLEDSLGEALRAPAFPDTLTPTHQHEAP